MTDSRNYMPPGLAYDRREYPRSEFAVQQPVAPVPLECPPSELQFRLRRCHDLGVGGFSYWSCELPPTEHVVLATESSDGYVELVADVRHCTEVTCLRAPLYLVGCRVVRRRK